MTSPVPSIVPARAIPQRMISVAGALLLRSGVKFDLSNPEKTMEAFHSIIKPLAGLREELKGLKLSRGARKDLIRFARNPAHITSLLLTELGWKRDRFSRFISRQREREILEKVGVKQKEIGELLEGMPDKPSDDPAQLRLKALYRTLKSFHTVGLVGEEDAVKDQEFLRTLLREWIIDEIIFRFPSIRGVVKGFILSGGQIPEEIRLHLEPIVSEVLLVIPAEFHEPIREFVKEGKITEKIWTSLSKTSEMLLMFSPTTREAIREFIAGGELRDDVLMLLAAKAEQIRGFRLSIASEAQVLASLSKHQAAVRTRKLGGHSRRSEKVEPLTLAEILANKEKYQREGVTIAVFDFDGTVRKSQLFRTGQLWLAWFLTEVLPHPKNSVGVYIEQLVAMIRPTINNWIKEKKEGHTDRGLTAHLISEFLKQEGIDQQKILRGFDRFVRAHGMDGISPYVRDLIKDHMGAGHLVLVSSGSPKELVKRVMETVFSDTGFPEENVRGTEFEVKEDRITGKFRWNYSEAKVEDIEENFIKQLKEAGIPVRIHFHSDSPSDEPGARLASKYGGVVQVINASREEWEREVQEEYSGIAVREKRGFAGLFFGAEGEREISYLSSPSEGNTVNIKASPREHPAYWDDVGKLAAEGATAGVYYYLGYAASEAVSQLVAGGVIEWSDALLSKGHAGMALGAAIFSALGSVLLPNDNTASWGRRVILQRFLPLIGGLTGAGLASPAILGGLGVALGIYLAESVLFLFIPHKDWKSPWKRHLRLFSQRILPLAAGGYLVGSPKDLSVVAGALLVACGTEALVNVGKVSMRSVGVDTGKRSWFGRFFGGSLAKAIEVVGYRFLGPAANFLSRFFG